MEARHENCAGPSRRHCLLGGASVPMLQAPVGAGLAGAQQEGEWPRRSA